jgi:multidrug efflux pump subunit AcrA (membrane-fusion protein)
MKTPTRARRHEAFLLARTSCAFLFLTLLAVLLAGCGKSDRSSNGLDSGPGVRAPVEMAKVGPINETYEAVGTVQSKTSSVLATRLAGNVVSVSVKPGDAVEEGQVLLQISNADLVAQVTKAKAGLTEAENALQEVEWAVKAGQSAKDSAEATKALATTNYKRLSTLLQSKSASQLEFDEAEAKYKTALAEADRAGQMYEGGQSRRKQVLAKIEQAKAEVANAEAQLPYARITSPIAGIVTMKNVDTGSFVSPGTPLLRVDDNRNYRVEVGVEDSQVQRVHLRDAAIVTVDALGDTPITAKVGEIVPASDPRNRSFLLKLDLPTVPSLRPGMFARAVFVVGQRQGLTLPPAAVVEHGQLLTVYVLDAQDVAHLRLVKTGRTSDGRIEILSGLNDGDRVVVDKTALVREGARVTPE